MRCIRRAPLAAAAAAAVFASGCLPSPLGLGKQIEGAESKEAVKSDPVIWIASPEHNQRIWSEVLFSSPGLEVTFEGEFVPGHTLHLSASPQDDPRSTFWVTRYALTEPVNPGPSRVRGDPVLLNGTRRVMLRLRVQDADDVLISLDSVRIRLR